MEKIKVLFLAANPIDTIRLRLDEEIREITGKIRASEWRDAVELISRWAVRPDDLLQALNEHRPHIVHFSGHGSLGEGIVLEDKNGKSKVVSKEAITTLFQTLSDNIRLVVFNACFSQEQAEGVTKSIDCAVGTNKSIGDSAAITFAASFYRAIGFGRSVQEAFDQGKTAVLLEGLSGSATFSLQTREGISASNVILVSGQADPSPLGIFKLLKQAPQELTSSMHIRDFEAVVREKTSRFLGRDFIFDRIDKIISDKDFPSGYIVIKGEPGIGKTALIAELVKRRNCIHHFNITAQNIRSTRCFLGNVCAQLIVKYGLDEKILPKEATEDSGYLLHLLRKAIAKTNGGPIIVAVDALDEADDLNLPAGANRLLLPPTLPKGVFFVVTMRETYQEHLFADERRDIPLVDNDPANIQDIKMYIQKYVDDHRFEIRSRIEEWDKSESEFVNILVEKSEGNFQYLHYVLPAIREGKLNKDRINRIEELPSGLKAYYERHWRSMRDQDTDRYRRLQRPILCFLTAARQPIGITTLLEWMKQVRNNPLIDPSDVRAVIQEWREYLNERKVEEGETLYNIYHTSFSEFIKEEEGLREYHSMIADSCIAAIEDSIR